MGCSDDDLSGFSATMSGNYSLTPYSPASLKETVSHSLLPGAKLHKLIILVTDQQLQYSKTLLCHLEPSHLTFAGAA